MPNILITNNQLRSFGGSEMITLELAEEFVAQGWDVDVYTNLLGVPFSREFQDLIDAGQCRVSDDPAFASDREYDLFWIHHSVIPPGALQGSAPATLPPVVWHHMSSFVDIEMPVLADIETRLATIISFVSPEARDALLPYGLPEPKTELFQNLVPQSFMIPMPGPTPPKLRSLLVVSNHPPAEVDEAARLLEEQGISVRRIGNTEPLRITSEAFTGVDAVLTIGKTVQYSLCLGLPVYVYDHFGGAGWLDEENFDTELDTNFSGRATRREATPSLIVEELLDGFQSAQSFSRRRLETHRQRFSLRRRISDIFERIQGLAPQDLSESDKLRWSTYNELIRSLYRSTVGANDTVEHQGNLLRQLSGVEEKAQSLSEENAALRNSMSYRLGNMLLKPVGRLRQH